MRLVIVESPFAGKGDDDLTRSIDRERNVHYARACMRDCLLRGEAPLASHLLYTQPGVLDDNDPAERTLGIEAGLVAGKKAEASVIYTDRGVSDGMAKGINRARTETRPVEFRELGADWEEHHNALVASWDDQTEGD